MKKFFIACGGTGGHLSPGIALAEGLTGRGHRCQLLVSKKKVDERLLQKYPDLNFESVPGLPFSMSPIRLCRFGFHQLRAFLHCWRRLKKESPDALIAFGGFSSVGSVLAALYLRVPVVLHEANRRPGKAIRLLAKKALRVYLPKGVFHRSIPNRLVRHYGYPIRKEIKRVNQNDARKNLGMSGVGKLLVVLGGSQGAVSLNQWVKDNEEQLAENRISVYCVTGLTNLDEEQEEKHWEGTTVRFVPFTDQMADVLSSADIVLSRAGAGSIAEIERCRVPSILIPYPHSADDHQLENAKFLERQGGTIVVPQDQLDGLFEEVKELIYNQWLKKTFCQKLEWIGREDHLKLILDDLDGIVTKRIPFERYSKAAL